MDTAIIETQSQSHPSVNPVLKWLITSWSLWWLLSGEALNNAEIWSDIANEHKIFDKLKAVHWRTSASARFFMIKALMLQA